MNRPWMPLYVADYLADTAHLGALESGAYLHLIMHYWLTGGLPDDARELARIAKVSSHNWKKLSPVIQKFFFDGWRHKRVDEEMLKAGNISEKRRAAANTRYEKTDAKAPALAVQLDTPSQSQSQSQREEVKKESSLRSADLLGDVPVSRETKTGSESDWPVDAFEQFWKKYPHKVGKRAAVKAFAPAKRTGVAWARVIFALDRYIAEKPADRAWCNPATWLNGGRWDDEPAALARATGPPGRGAAQPSFREIAATLRNGHENSQPRSDEAEHVAGASFDFAHDVPAGRGHN